MFGAVMTKTLGLTFYAATQTLTVYCINQSIYALSPPSTTSQHYNLRRRTHTLSLPEHFTYLSDCNFITPMLYKHSY